MPILRAMVSDSSSRRAAGGTSSRGSEALQRLKRGELRVEEYLETKVDRAVARLGTLVTPEQRRLLREVVWEHCLTDPVVGEYLRRLTGGDLPADVE